MMGQPGLLEEKGLIPRSLEQIFQTRQSLQPQGWKYEMQVREKEDGSFLFYHLVCMFSTVIFSDMFIELLYIF